MQFGGIFGCRRRIDDAAHTGFFRQMQGSNTRRNCGLLLQQQNPGMADVFGMCGNMRGR
jgi:hypothetical protein